MNSVGCNILPLVTDSLYASHEDLHLYKQRMLDNDLHHIIRTFFLPWHHTYSPRNKDKVLFHIEGNNYLHQVFQSHSLYNPSFIASLKNSGLV